VKYALATDDHMRILQAVSTVDATEIGLARTEYDRHHVHRYFVDQAGRKDLAAYLAGIHSDVSVGGQLAGRGYRSGHVVDEMVGGFGVPVVGFGAV
jgi:hypothetical protein